MGQTETQSQSEESGSFPGRGEGGFKETYGRSIAVVFAALLVTHLPIISLIGLLPMLKEVVIGAAIVGVMTSIADAGEAAKYALISGMTAAVVFNIIWIPAQFIFGLAMASGGPEAAATGMLAGTLGAIGAFSNLIGLLIFSPIGYSVGGVLGSLING